jgi:hypothetical protein
METTSFLDNIEFAKNTKLNYIQRKWYGKYIFKLVVEVDRSKLVKTPKTHSFHWTYAKYANSYQLAQELTKEIANLVNDQDYRLRREGTRISFFTNSDACIKLIVDQYKDRVLEIDRPLNENHVQVIEQHRKVVVRKNLFLDHYKFKIYIQSTWAHRTDRYSHLKEFLETLDDYEINGILRSFFYSNISANRLGYTIAVYLNSAEDLMMFQLRFNDEITKVEEAVLLSDLDK